MKKIVFTLLFFALYSSTFAQSDGFRFGFQATPMYTWLHNNSNNEAVVGDKGNVAFKLGAIGEFYFDSNERFALRTGIDMTFNQGGSLLFNGISTDSIRLFKDSQPDVFVSGTPSAQFSYQYIEIPFALKMRTKEFGYIRAVFEVPTFTLGVNVGSRGKINNEGDFKTAKDTGLLQFSWGMGGGIEYGITEDTALTTGLYFQSGLINTYSGTKGEAGIETARTIVNGVALRVGVLF